MSVGEIRAGIGWATVWALVLIFAVRPVVSGVPTESGETVAPGAALDPGSAPEAEEPTASLEHDGESPLRAGRPIVGLFVSHGFAQSINRSARIDVTSFGGRWSRPGAATGSGWLRAHPTLGVELVPALIFSRQPRPLAMGANLLYEHRFVTAGGVLPVLRAGAGALVASDRVPAGETRINFSLLVGFGLDFRVHGRRYLSLGYRLHHISNAGRGGHNPGINTHTLMCGFTTYLD